MDPDLMAKSALPVQVQTFDGPLGRRIIDTHIWAVREGLRGATSYDLFDGYCQRWFFMAYRSGAPTPQWRLCIRNGAATAIHGDAN